MKLSLPFPDLPFLIETDLTLKPRKSGLAIAVGSKSPGLPKITATLVLRWAELLLIAVLLVIGGLIIHFRERLAATSLVATWAPGHLRITVTTITLAAFVLGFVIALWKKKQLFTYGIAEIAFALFTIFQIALHLWPLGRLADFVALGSALYVVSRGFGNFWDAFINETEIERVALQVGTGTVRSETV